MTTSIQQITSIMRVVCLPAGLREGLRTALSSRNTTSSSPIRQAVHTAARRQFQTSSRLQAGIAAPEIKFKDEGRRDGEGDEAPFFARLVPTSPSYFTAQPTFTDDLLVLQNLVDRNSSFPTVKPGTAPRVAWRTLMEYRNIAGESVKPAKYHKIIELLQRLNAIHPALQRPEVKQAINEYKRDIDPFKSNTELPLVDSLGRTLGSGRRKSSTARAWVVEGTGEVLVNGKTLAETFGRIHDRESAIWALKATDRMDKYNVWALVEGGGTTGQAEALTLAVGKALLAQEPALKPALRRAGCMTRDPRRVERKKPGHVKARKMPAWVKR
ncbi:37S ribosomal protein s9 [Drepanopeziza brunnea f. sp. 'multigermtubi' MB_m1]|uniref:Small ribosomal subunit protein uS9m n=1 Tax=Marssonina brunnea f. sp. multigermtubi (strain MB_m1) TaxID=1072389 RepID=K1W8L1_MARBU|nr:37S ribosomal protein s9 [Drepanopeziza brunnea f. sp. 'multigermtubi' MB_m1]EKD13530.1 37S ribosomal protein s9 [Drepanopeziza brunnea f. sp. 'multigermtubi' MB_m1]